MANYANGKIYKIVGDTGITYYGSTTVSLRDRMYKHRGLWKAKMKTSAYREIISQMECEMILVENYPCDSKKELEDREAWYIRGNPCVNQCIPGRTQKEYRKKYYEEHCEEAKARSEKYNRWKSSFGDPRSVNCVQRCDPSLFT